MSKKINYLENWAVLNSHVQKLSEETILSLIEIEKKGEARPQFLLRLYGRYNVLRTTRERRTLLSSKK